MSVKKSNADKVRASRLENSNVCGQPRSPRGVVLGTIPTGRQLPRTPVKRTSLGEKKNEIETRDILASKHGINDENTPYSGCFPIEVRDNPVKDGFGKGVVPEHRETDEGLQRKFVRRPSTISVTTKQPEEMSPDCFVKTMVGYQWTQEDLEFVENTKTKRLVQQMKNELSVLRKQLTVEQQKRGHTLASRGKLLANHPEAAAVASTVHLARDFLSQRLGAAEVEALDPKSLLAQIQGAEIQQDVHQERLEVAELEKKLTAAQKLRKCQEKQSREAEQQENEILQKQAKVDGLNNELAELKSKLLQAENALQATQKQMEVHKVPEPTKDESEVDMDKVLRRSRRIAKRKDNFQEREAILRKIRSVT
ncbi:hypothetical protein COCON_G00198090 [Conger conger]|uniref:Uncharacterized protein n=1 Tax=Conger conger TaxID=82655 RepID=A0A9Q1D1Q4_CONCO|nr:uncharacterized protein LOC133116394 [Conger conger]KAJ8255945.1 hypothetical protein COCON_G00198090 [Conger conger]